jgi:tRNA G10  N-methylase Trm11
MVRLTRPQPDDVFVNACCGSGTLLAERLRYSAARALGFDSSEAALACSQANLQEHPSIALIRADAGDVPLPDGSVSAVVADPPFGMLQTADASLRLLYTALFRESGRVLKPGGSFAVISTQRRLLRELLAAEAAGWSEPQTVDLKLPFEHGYIRPSIYVLRRE